MSVLIKGGLLIETTGLLDDSSPMMHIKTTCLSCGQVLIDRDFDARELETHPEKFEEQGRSDAINTLIHMQEHEHD